VNGEAREFSGEMTLAQLLANLGIGEQGVAVACNEVVVRRGSLAEQCIVDGDRIEIVRAVAGG